MWLRISPPSGGTGSLGAIVRFFALTYAVSWPCFTGFASLSGDAPPADPARAAARFLLLYLGIFAPALVALGLTAREGGGAAVRALLRRLLDGAVGARWYLFAAGYMAAIKLATALLHRVATGEWPRMGAEAWYVLVAATVFSTVTFVQTGEELGWRGYALPRLAARLGLGPASVVLGLLWACWHLPLFFAPGTDKYHQSFPGYALSVTALSVAMAWLYGHTRGSLLLAMLMHSAVNQSVGIVSSAVPGATNPLALNLPPAAWITIALLWICGGYFLVRMPDAPAAGSVEP